VALPRRAGLPVASPAAAGALNPAWSADYIQVTKTVAKRPPWTANHSQGELPCHPE